MSTRTISDNFNSSYTRWKNTWLNQIISMIVVGLASSILIVPVALILAMVVILQFGIDAEITIENFDSMLDFMLNYPLVSLAILGVTLIGVIAGTFILASMHLAADSNSNGFELSQLTPLKDNFWGLVTVAIGNLIVIGSPLAILQLILDIIIPESQELWLMLLNSIISIVIFVVLAPPFFLGMDEAIFNNKGAASFIDGWKRYLENFSQVFSNTLVFFIPIIVGGLIIAGFALLIPMFAGVDIFAMEPGMNFDPTNLDAVSIILILVVTLVIFILGLIEGFILVPLFFTCMYTLFTSTNLRKVNKTEAAA